MENQKDIKTIALKEEFWLKLIGLQNDALKEDGKRPTLISLVENGIYALENQRGVLYCEGCEKRITDDNYHGLEDANLCNACHDDFVKEAKDEGVGCGSH